MGVDNSHTVEEGEEVQESKHWDESDIHLK
jgi:hypothetical protein